MKKRNVIISVVLIAIVATFIVSLSIASFSAYENTFLIGFPFHFFSVRASNNDVQSIVNLSSTVNMSALIADILVWGLILSLIYSIINLIIKWRAK